MSYDLYAWPVEGPMTADEARVEIQSRAGKWPLGLGRDKRVARFARELEQRYPGLGSPNASMPMEFDVHRDWVFMGLPWAYVAGLVEAIGPVAFETGLALYDPQRDMIALPAPFGDAPLSTAGIAEHERLAERTFDALLGGAGRGGGDPLGDVVEELRHAGGRVMSPLGFEITPELADEVRADPLRVPTALQNPAKRAELLAQLEDPSSGVRQRALTMLTGWDPDPDVRGALRAHLDANDVYVVGLACAALARQANPLDLGGLLGAVHRMSPADGGSLDSMLMPLTAALDLARRSGPAQLAEVKARAREWRHPRPGAPPRPRGALDEELDRLLADD